ncbi:Peptidase family S49 [[Luteovulum] sphaeroides subsp. megalophilum]|uniref:S49 family peptidase n=1 Tax=Cereibacter sphaeroides TaxID=1063 RepID=UPI000B7227AE|nr:S49 family peptidase [Cereibacter sphaeroides]SNT42564.1 Peptidase family S49 [[Luteovulum] sphaeroides subsp. megalophilum]
MTRTLASLFGPLQPMALAEDLAASLLVLAVPEGAGDPAAAARAPTAGPTVPDRFTVARGLAVVPVRGILTPNMAQYERWFGWATYHGLAETLAHLAASEDAAAIVLEIDSPGGLVTGIEAAAEAIAAAAVVKPVHALVSPLAASAAYWLASQASEIVMTPGAVAGSIGVALTAAAHVQPGANGAQIFEMSSRHARAKRPDASTEAGRAELQRSLDEAEAAFHAAVSAGRAIPAAELAARLSVTDDPQDGGATFRAPEAIRRGLADRTETRATFYARLTARTTPKPRSPSRAFAARAAAAIALARS